MDVSSARAASEEMVKTLGDDPLSGGESMANRLTVGMSEPLALRAPDAALVLGLSERKFRELAPSLPSVDLGGVTVYPVEALRE